MYYDAYSIENGQDKVATKALYSILFAYSDSFSLVYCKPNVQTLFHLMPVLIKWRLRKYLLQTKQVSSWPGTWIGKGSKQMYFLQTYQTNYKAFEIISCVSILWKWNAPAYPMDLCFYKNGIAWFELTAHEHLSKLYIGREGCFPLKEDIESLGIQLEFVASVNEDKLYHT